MLRELLARTEQIDDLRHLFGALGFQAAWEHVRSHLTALLAGSPSTAGGAGKPGSNDGKFDYHE